MAYFQNHMNALENFSSSAWYLILNIHSHSAPILKNSVVGMEISYALKLLSIFHVPDSWDGTSGSWQSHHNSRMALLKRNTFQGSPSSLWEGVSKYHYSIHIQIHIGVDGGQDNGIDSRFPKCGVYLLE